MRNKVKKGAQGKRSVCALVRVRARFCPPAGLGVMRGGRGYVNGAGIGAWIINALTN